MGAKYTFERIDTGTQIVFLNLDDREVQALTDGILVRTSKLTGKPIRYKLVSAWYPTQFPGSTYPMESDAAGINPDQIPDAMAADKAAGLSGVRYNPQTGAAIFTDRAMRKKYCERHNIFDRNGGYSDPQHSKTPGPESA